MATQPFRFSASLPELPKGAERSLIAQFRAIQADLDQLREAKVATPVIVAPIYAARAGELVLLEPPAGGVKVSLPTGNAANIRQHVLIALVGGTLSVTISIIGAVGTINGAQTLTMTARGLLDLVSVGDRGWVVHAASGGGGLSPPVALTDLASIASQTWLGNITGGAAPATANTVAQMKTYIGVFGAATTGLVPASGGGTTTFLRADGTFAAPAGGGGYATIKNNGAAVTVRTAFDARAGTGTYPSISLVATDDAVNSDTDLTASIGTMAAQSISANATGGAAQPAALAVGTNTVVGRVAGNVVAAPLVNAQVDAAAGINFSKLEAAAANTFLANATAGAAAPTAIALGTESIPGRSAGNIATFASAAQSAFIRAAGSLFFATAAAGQHLRRSLAGGDLGFSSLEVGTMGAPLVANVTATNTTNAVAASFTIPANALVAGSTFRLTAYFTYVHTAESTLDVIAAIAIAGTEHAVATTDVVNVAKVAPGMGGMAVGLVTFRTIGATGTVLANVKVDYDLQTVNSTRGSTVTAVVGTVNTTGTLAMELRLRLAAAAVAGNTLTVTHGVIERLN